MSSIKYQKSSSHIEHDLDNQLIPVLSAWLKACRRETAFSPAVPYNLDVVSHLFILHHNVIHQIPRLADLAYHEEEFKSKHVYPLLCMVFSKMTLRCDIASNAYKHTNTNVLQRIRPDFLVLDNETELIAIEVKPFNTTQSLIEEDEVRVAELSKKMLHMRMARAKTVKEFCSFGICIAGNYN
ncbi:hypothetical protein HMPREF1544_09433 [Mucor circinelloides 1006PhL]|uniref:Uncharacterized protein n=1 Tax=Mucor circinelloides f. circinelloides (strain 1006PhL) TaxID=1220926 RepID=S2JVD9_MUCC1|nr:hypothetical protein HMPREF1544_09433 [Mucor circinelloides 1006PhL]KAG1105408.1 hypothetical protein G6F42_016966 [Rhizopus arrhizus]